MDRLPPELLLEIFAKWEPCDFSEPTGEHISMLKSACLVNSTWNSHVQPIVWRFVLLNRSNIRRFHSFIENKPRFAHYVHVIQFFSSADFDQVALNEVLKTCTELRAISLQWLARHASASFQLSTLLSSGKLKRLNLLGPFDILDDSDTEQAPGLCSLSGLMLGNVRGNGIIALIQAPNLKEVLLTIDDGADDFVEQTLPVLRTSVEIKSFEILMLRMFDGIQEALQELLNQLPNIRHLTLRPINVDAIRPLPSILSFSLRLHWGNESEIQEEMEVFNRKILSDIARLPRLHTITYLSPVEGLLEEVRRALDGVDDGFKATCRARGITLDAKVGEWNWS
ncbi:hypothetical protein T439DRAFT_329021 [Meredithblackwellia eburnea MCA 4105]